MIKYNPCNPCCTTDNVFLGGCPCDLPDTLYQVALHPGAHIGQNIGSGIIGPFAIYNNATLQYYGLINTTIEVPTELSGYPTIYFTTGEVTFFAAGDFYISDELFTDDNTDGYFTNGYKYRYLFSCSQGLYILWQVYFIPGFSAGGIDSVMIRRFPIAAMSGVPNAFAPNTCVICEPSFFYQKAWHGDPDGEIVVSAESDTTINENLVCCRGKKMPRTLYWVDGNGTVPCVWNPVNFTWNGCSTGSVLPFVVRSRVDGLCRCTPSSGAIPYGVHISCAGGVDLEFLGSIGGTDQVVNSFGDIECRSSGDDFIIRPYGLGTCGGLDATSDPYACGNITARNYVSNPVDPTGPSPVSVSFPTTPLFASGPYRIIQ